jgi:hypothetical protein
LNFSTHFSFFRFLDILFLYFHCQWGSNCSCSSQFSINFKYSFSQTKSFAFWNRKTFQKKFDIILNPQNYSYKNLQHFINKCWMLSNGNTTIWIQFVHV